MKVLPACILPLLCVLAVGACSTVVRDAGSRRPPSDGPALGQKSTLVLDKFLGAERPQVEVSIVAVRNSTRVKLTADRFQEYLDAGGADYVVHIVEPYRSRHVAEFLQKVEFVELADRERAYAMRYQIKLMDGDEVIRTLYVGPSGDVVDGQRALRPVDGHRWLVDLWTYFEFDLIQK